MKFLLLFLLIYYPARSQDKIQNYKFAAQKALNNGKLEQALEIYRNLVEMQPTDKDNWFNLASVELGLQQTDAACEHLYQAYLRYDGEARGLMTLHCQNFKEGRIKFLDEVDQVPKLIWNGKEIDIFTDKGLNSDFVKIIAGTLKNSKILKSKKLTVMSIELHISADGVFDGAITRSGATVEDDKIVKDEILYIFKNTFKFIPAVKDGISVELWNRFVLAIRFNT